MSLEEHYFWHLAEPYLRQRLGWDEPCPDDEARQKLLAEARARGIKIHFLKRLANPRMTRALGMVKQAWPESLLDVGAGKGFLLWHLSECLPETRVVALDCSLSRARRLQQLLKVAGLGQYAAVCAQAERLPFAAKTFQVVALFEVLEHLPEPKQALREAVRVARNAVLLSVPCKPDSNPEHRHLFDPEGLRALLRECGLGPATQQPRIAKDDAHYYVFAAKCP